MMLKVVMRLLILEIIIYEKSENNIEFLSSTLTEMTCFINDFANALYIQK